MQPFNKEKPYNKLPSLLPEVDLETKEVMRKTIKASRALAQLNGTHFENWKKKCSWGCASVPRMLLLPLDF